MGLDMYALSCAPDKVIRRDLGVDQLPTWRPVSAKDVECFHEWRKHPDLHQWFTDLYFNKEGLEGDITMTANGPAFNANQFVRLTEQDLDRLEVTIISDALPKGVGHLWGSSNPLFDKADDLAFIAKAREALKLGKVVFYTSWW